MYKIYGTILSGVGVKNVRHIIFIKKAVTEKKVRNLKKIKQVIV